MWLESLSASKDHAEKCPTCGGGVQRRTYGEMYAGTFLQDGKRVDIRSTPPAEFRDPVVLDELTQYFDGGLYRMWPSERYLARGGRRLHRDVWKAAFGSIPHGCHIHHRDGNLLNNALGNLECLDEHTHLAETWERTRRERESNGHFTDKARIAAAAWHASPEGRLWHSRHAKREQNWTKWQREERLCRFCQKPFACLLRANGHHQKYCSASCKAADYRRRQKAQCIC